MPPPSLLNEVKGDNNLKNLEQHPIQIPHSPIPKVEIIIESPKGTTVETGIEIEIEETELATSNHF